MKAQKKLNVVLVVLVIILISVISFVGIYHLDKNQMVNMLPSYILGTNISGYRKVVLELKDSEAESGSETVELGEATISDTNETENQETEQQGTEEKEEKESPEEKIEKYRKSVEIIKARLKAEKVEDFTITCDQSTGNIELKLPENDQTDIILSDITQVGKFQITDTNTGEVLMTNEDIRSATIGKTEQYGYTLVRLDIKFTASGSRKFKNITQDYNENAVIEQEVSNETENEEANEVNEGTYNNETDTLDVQTGSNETTDSNESTETIEKQVTLKIDDSEMLSTRFPEIVDNGVLTLTIGTSADSEEVKNSVYGGYNIAAMLENDPLPIEYEVAENVYIESNLDMNDIKIIIGILVGIAVLISIVMIVKFKMKGLLASILSTGFVALLLIVIRYTNVTVSIEGIMAIGLAFIINTIFNYILLNNIKSKYLSKDERIEKYYDAMKKYALSLIPILLLSIVCCFTNWDTIYSFGMVIFWTILISLLYNLTVTNLLVRNK